MNLPNKLTLTRVLLIPLFIVFILLKPQFDFAKYIAVGIFVLASFTDWLDGRIARKQNLVTNFGKFMDPLADKLLVCSALISLVYLAGHGNTYTGIPLWVVLVIVAREFTISGFRLVAAEKGIVLAASKIAKVKTAVQMVMTVALILDFPNPFWKIFCIFLIYAALILTVVSLIEYLYRNRILLKDDID